MIEGDRTRYPATSGLPAFAQENPAGFKIDLGRLGANELRAVKAAAQGRANVARFQTASRHLGEHWSEEKRVCVAYQSDRCLADPVEFPFQAFGGVHPCKTSAQNHDVCMRFPVWL